MLKIVLLLGAVAYASAIVCLPETCQLVRCAAIEAADCNGYVKPNGGMCGCCDACITTIPQGGKCLGIMLLGVAPTTECSQGLHCDMSTHTCQPAPVKREVGACAAKLAEVNQQLSSSQHLMLGLEKPRCDANGDYSGMQTMGSTAYCVTKEGKDLSDLGYSVPRWQAGADMNCQCARDLYNYMQSGLIGKLFNCEANGNYPTPAPSKRAIDVTCAQHLKEVNARLEASNHMLMGLEKPHCDNATGDYLGMQFAGSQAYCVTKDGTSLNYMVNRWETGDHMDCQCARDLYDYQQLGIVGKTFNCLANGNYSPTQCLGSVCYCVDNMGQKVGTSTVSIGQMGSLNC